MRRRAALGGAAAAWAGGLLGTRAGRAAGIGVPVVPARVVRNGWGVCGRPGIDAAADRMAAMMAAIGTQSLRTPVSEGGTAATDRILALRAAMAGTGAAKLRLAGLVTAYRNDPRTTWPGQQDILLALAKAGVLAAIEGPNELNNRATGEGAHGPEDREDRTGPGAYPANALAWARAVATFRREQAGSLAGVTVVAPSIASGLPADYAALPRLTGLVDAGNLHFYAGGGRQPSFSLPPNPAVGSFASVFGWAQAAQLPGGPMWLTEAGASTSGNYAADGRSQARYVANQLFDLFAAGGARMFLYQLIDGSGRPGDVEGNFGLFRHDGQPKPVAAMLGTLKHLLSRGRYEDPANAADTAPLPPAPDLAALSIAAASPVSALTMPRSDGSAVLAVWNEPPIDDGHGTSLEPAATMATVEFGQRRNHRAHDLLAAALPPDTAYDTARTVTLALRGSPVLVELLPAGT